jgi:hypothetical protein
VPIDVPGLGGHTLAALFGRPSGWPGERSDPGSRTLPAGSDRRGGSKSPMPAPAEGVAARSDAVTRIEGTMVPGGDDASA